jgi:putative endonuclease
MAPEEHHYYVYIVASRSRVLYVGVTNNLRRRVRQHQLGTFEGFSAQFACKRLVWFQQFQYINQAILREKQIKSWRRDKKLSLITETNPTWLDLTTIC